MGWERLGSGADDGSDGDSTVDLRATINDLYIQTARHDFELGLSMLAYDDGQYEIFADDARIAGSSDVSLELGGPASGQGYVEIPSGFDFPDEHGASPYERHGSYVYSVAIGPNGFGYSGSRDGTIRKWDLATMTEQGVFEGHMDSIYALALDADGFGYSGSRDGTVRKWDTETMGEVAAFSGHTSTIQSVAIDPDGFIYSGAWDDTVRRLDPETMTEQDVFDEHTNRVRSVAIGPDGFGYSASSDATIRKWDLETMTEQATFTGHPGSVYEVAIGPDEVGYSGSYGGTIRKWDLETMTEQGVFEEHTGAITSIDFDATGVAYSASYDNTVRRWDLETMTEQGVFEGHMDNISALALDTDRFAYSGSNDMTVRKWYTSPDAPTEGFVRGVTEDMGFVPASVVLSDEERQFPTGADRYYVIEDGDGNTVELTSDDLDTEIDTSALTSPEVSVTVYLTRTESGGIPQLDAWSAYMVSAEKEGDVVAPTIEEYTVELRDVDRA